MINQLNYSDISNVYLFLVKREKSGVNRTAEYKQVLASVGKAYGALKDEFLAEVPDNAVCIIADDLPNTHQYQFVRNLAERVRRDASKVYTYAGYRFKTVNDGCVSPAQAVFVYNRMPFTPRHTKGDSSDEIIDVMSHGTMACSCSILKKIKQEEPAGSNKNETRSVACSKLGIQIVCVVPSKDWSELPRTARPVEAVIRLSSIEHGVVFSYKEWRKPPVVSFARHTLYNTPVPTCNNSTAVKTTDLVAVIVTTHNRTETAKTTLKSLVEHLKYPRLYWIIADDKSDKGHIESLLAYMHELGVSDGSMTCTKTTNEHWGLGASLNNALSVAFRITDVVLTTEDDWYLQFDFDISEYVDIIKNDSSIGTIRLGAANHLTRYLTEYNNTKCLEVNLKKYIADLKKTGRANSLQVALRHKRMFDTVGYYVENKHPDIVESDMNRRFVDAERLKILWPSSFKTYALVCSENPFIHFGESTVGHLWDTTKPVKLQKTIIGMASYKARESGMLKVVAALAKQCDHMFVALNGYKEDEVESIQQSVPYGNVTFVGYRGDDDLGCQNKFRFITECKNNDYYLTVDDDIAYPDDYVDKLTRCIDSFGGRAYVSYHGSRFVLDDGVIAQASKKIVFTYGKNVHQTVRINMAGTGVGGCIPSMLGLDFSIFNKKKNTGDDELLAIWARDHGVPMYVLKHKTGWLSTHETVEKTGALWRNLQSMSDRMVMLRESGQWPDFSAEPTFFRVVIPVHGSVKTLKRALASITQQTSKNYVVSVCDDHSSEEDAEENEKSVKALGQTGIFSRLVDSRYAGAARNEAMRHATNTRYTLFLDADDEFTFPTMFEELQAFIETHNYPDVVVLPFYGHDGRSTVSELAHMRSPEAFAASRYQAPWVKCIKTDIVPKFQENMRRSNDVMQHFLTADIAKTVIPFNKACVRYNRDGETTMFGDRRDINRKSVDALGCLLKSAADILMTTWNHDYMKGPVARCALHIIKQMVPGSVKFLEPSLSKLVKTNGLK